MEKLAQAFTEAEKTQVYRYETVHEIIQKLMGNCQETSGLSKEDTPVCLWQTKNGSYVLLVKTYIHTLSFQNKFFLNNNLISGIILVSQVNPVFLDHTSYV